MAKANKQVIIDEIVKEIQKGKTFTETFGVIRSKSKLAESTFASYWKDATMIVSERNIQKERLRQEITEQTFKEAVNESIISDLELEAILCTIATGNIVVEEIIKGKAILRNITPMEQIAAIDKIYKKRGSNAPVKSALTNKDGEDVQPITHVQIVQPIPLDED